MKDASVFISHSSVERSAAFHLKDQLELNGFDAWTYEIDLPFAESIAERVKSEITECDHFVLLLSERACQSKWVAWELGLALQLREQRGEKQPTITGVICNGLETLPVIQPLEFLTETRFGPPFSFQTLRNHRLHDPEEFVRFVQQLIPRVTFITHTDGRQGELLRDSFKSYEALFPDDPSRDDPSAIEHWLDESRMAEQLGSPWRDVYAVLHMGELVIGMAFLTLHVERHWCFANYFGIKRAWRHNRRAEWFLREIRRQLLHLDPTINGIVFEADTIDFNCLAEALDRGSIRGCRNEAKVLENLRHLRRLYLYQVFGAKTILSGQDRPLQYWQPALDLPLDPTGESQYILMVYLLDAEQYAGLKLSDLLDFVYEDLYADAYGLPNMLEIPGYRPYVESVRRRVEELAGDTWTIGKMPIKRDFRRLLTIARDEDLTADLHL